MKEIFWHSMDVGGVLEELETDSHRGLDDEEIKKRIEEYGYNELKQEEGSPPSPYYLTSSKTFSSSFSLWPSFSRRWSEK